MAISSVPKSVTDAFLHLKNGSKTERIVLPFTRYNNVANRPIVVTTAVEAVGREFSLLKVDEEEVPDEDVTSLLGLTL